MQLVNKQNQLEEIPDEQVNDALSSGNYGIQQGTHNMIDPDGSSVGVDANNAFDALKQGYRFETPEESKINDYIENNQGFGGDIKQFSRSLLNQFTLGASNQALEAAGEFSPEEETALRGDHTAAAVGGGVIGNIASFFTPIGPGKLLASGGKELVQGLKLFQDGGLAAKLAAGAGEGLAISAPSAITTGLTGDPKEMAAEFFVNGGLGAALGGIGSGMGDLLQSRVGNGILNKIGKYISNSSLDSMVGLDSNTAKEYGPDAINGMRNKMETIRTQNGGKFGTVGETLNSLNELGATTESGLGGVIDTSQDMLDSNQIEQPETLKSNFFEDVGKKYLNMPGLMTNEKTEISNLMEDIRGSLDENGNMPLDKSREFDKSYGESAYDYSNGMPTKVRSFMKEIERGTQSGYEQAVDQAIKVSPESFDQSAANYIQDHKDIINLKNIVRNQMDVTQDSMVKASLKGMANTVKDNPYIAVNPKYALAKIAGSAITAPFKTQTGLNLLYNIGKHLSATDAAIDGAINKHILNGSVSGSGARGGLIRLADQILGFPHENNQQAFMTVHNAINQDPNTIMQNVGKVVGDTNSPYTNHIVQHVGTAAGNMIGYLQSISPQPKALSGFPDENTPEKLAPSESQLNQFDSQISSMDPRAYSEIMMGSGNNLKQTKALQNMLPASYSKITSKIQQSAMKDKLSVSQKANYNRILGYNISNRTPRGSIQQYFNPNPTNTTSSTRIRQSSTERRSSINNQMGGVESVLKRK
jgi:hypothetical protein